MSSDRGAWVLLGCLGLAGLVAVASTVAWFVLRTDEAPTALPVASAPAVATAAPVNVPVALSAPDPPSPPPEPPPVAVDPSPPPAGDLGASDVQHVVASHSSDARRCFEAALRRNPSASGRVVIQLVIAPSGAVSSARATESTVSSSVSDCIASAVRGWTFPAHDGEPTTVRVPFQMVGSAPAADAPAEEAPAPLDRATLQQALRALAPTIRECAGETRGAAIIRVTFAPTGDVTSAVVVGETFAGTEAGECMARAARDVRVRPFEGSPVTVTYPFSVR